MTEPSSSAGAPSLLLLTHFTPLCVLRQALAGAVFPSRFTREVPGRAGPSPKASTPCPLPAGSPAHKGTLSRLNDERRCDAEAAKCSRQVQGSLPNRRAARRLGEKPPAAGNVHAAAACPLPGGTEPPHTPPGGKKGSLQPPGLVWREKSHCPNGTRGREERLWGGGKALQAERRHIPRSPASSQAQRLLFLSPHPQKLLLGLLHFPYKGFLSRGEPS